MYMEFLTKPLVKYIAFKGYDCNQKHLIYEKSLVTCMRFSQYAFIIVCDLLMVKRNSFASFLV